MSHYVCPDCLCEKEELGSCTSGGCTHEGKPLVKCNCDDGTHPGIKAPCPHCGGLCKKEGGCAIEPFKEELSA